MSGEHEFIIEFWGRGFEVSESLDLETVTNNHHEIQ